MDGLQPVEPVEVAKVGVEGVGVEKVRELVEEAEVVSGWEPVGEVGGWYGLRLRDWRSIFLTIVKTCRSIFPKIGIIVTT